ncbi:hypothetical protein PHLCEN_2v9741 [Hermanssonia centrifuga]|uniref:Protein kinase domain-containing protein n=1 Tax=Hermanssonia centrifuga TaxID=98765 RepID=A0A2R6NPY3_9APHY|nr:hypothetical protein PHLCEN_2v9741 [Hermanssonia centrifuga]
MVYQMLDCLHDLRYKAKILHRDVSANNIMWEMQGEEVVFKLIDFDFATFVDDEGKATDATARSKHRTGTLAFMAFELVKDMAHRDNPLCEPVFHLLHHDFESLYHLSAYSMIVIPEGEDADKRELYRESVWLCENGMMQQIAACKALSWEWRRMRSLRLPPQSEPLRPWLLRFSDLLYAAQQKVRIHDMDESVLFDHETMGGMLTRDVITSVLKGESVVTYGDVSFVPVPQEACGSGTSHEEMIEEKATIQNESTKLVPERRAPAKKATAKGKKVATAKAITPKKIAAKASKTKDTASKAKLVVTSGTMTAQALMRRGPTTRSMTKNALIVG